jgi:hypothetical protein
LCKVYGNMWICYSAVPRLILVMTFFLRLFLMSKCMLEAFAFSLCDQYSGAMIKKANTSEPLWMCCKTEALPPHLICLVYITEYCYGEEKLMSRVWQIYMFSASLNAKKKQFLICCPSVYKMCALLMPECLNRFCSDSVSRFYPS